MTLPLNRVIDANALMVHSPHLESALKELERRRAHNEAAAAYYEGEVPEVFASVRLRRAMMRTGINFRFNFAKTPVDAITDRLEIASVRSTNDAATQALNDLWKANQLDLEAPNIHRRAGEFGDAYVIVWPRETGPVLEDDEDSDAYTAPEIGIYYNSSDCVQLFYDSENPLVKSHAVKRWRTDDDRWRVDLLYPDRIERYISKKDQKGERATDYEPHVVDYDFVDSQDGELIQVPIWPAENPFGELPVFHFRNDRPYGTPEHKGFYGPQDAITKLIVAHMSGVDYTAAPQRYALMEADSDTSEPADVDEDEFTFRVDGEAEAGTHGSDGQGRSQLSSDPGSLWLLRGMKGVGQFETADPKSFLEPMERYLRFGAQITGTPLRLFDYESSRMPSGASQHQADGPFVKKIRNRQLSYGGTWQDVLQFALRLMGFEDADVTVLWAPPNVVDDEAGWKVIQMKLEVGVPFEQVMREAGYDQDLITKWVADRVSSDDDANGDT